MFTNHNFKKIFVIFPKIERISWLLLLVSNPLPPPRPPSSSSWCCPCSWSGVATPCHKILDELMNSVYHRWSPVHNLFELKLDSQFYQSWVLKDSVCNPGLHPAILFVIPFLVTRLLPVAHLLLHLPGHPHLYQPILAAGQGLKKARQGVRTNPVAFKIKRQERLVLF